MLCGPSINDFISNEEQTCIEDENLDSSKNITKLIDLGPVGQSLELKLINENVLGNNSNMYPWITVMPNITDYSSHLYTWRKREKKEIRKSRRGIWKGEYKRRKKVLQELMQMQNNLCEKYQNKTNALMKKILCNRTLWIWASISKESRSMQIDNEKCFIPPASFLNHHDDGIEVTRKEGKLTMVSNREYIPGEEIFLRYWGKKQYEQEDGFLKFSFSYMFVPQWTSFTIPNPFLISKDQDDFTEFEWYIENENCFVLSKADRTLKKDLKITDELMHCFRIVALGDQEWEDNFADNLPEVGSILSIKNEISSLSLFIQTLHDLDFGVRTRKEDEILASSSDSSGIKFIAQVRLAERNLIDSYINFLQQKIVNYQNDFK